MLNEKGFIEVVCGSMFSGKSEELIRRVRRLQYAKKKVQVFKPAIDNRYHEESVVSHNGTSVEAVAVHKALDILDKLEFDTFCVAIDEVQFFDEQIVEVTQALANRGLRVICAGLDQDFKGDAFGPIPYLLALAESVTKLQAVCVSCGAPASRTQRLINGQPAHIHDPIVLVGASESYEARCRSCHQVVGKEENIQISSL